jgi:general secretion pathway protein D
LIKEKILKICFVKGATQIFVWLVVFSVMGCVSMKEIRLGDQFAEEGNWEGSLIHYQMALDKDPTNLEVREKLIEAKKRVAALHFVQGKQLLQEKEIELAIQEFKRALSLDPSKKEHQNSLAGAMKLREAQSFYKLGERFANISRFDDAISEFEKALELDPSHVLAQEGLIRINALMEKQKAEGELALKSTQPITLKFQNARLKEVFELLAKTSGINILFDKDVRDDNVTIFVRDVSFNEALNLILATNNLFMKKINEETILIVPKIKQKVDQYQDLLIRTFYLSNVPAKDMVNLLRTMLETRRVFVNNDLNAIVLRDTPEKIELAEKIIHANDRKVAEVTFDVEILEVNEQKMSKLGWNFSSNQAQFSLTPPGGTVSSSGATTISVEQLTNLGTAAYLFTLPSVIIDFLKTNSDAKTLANPKIRILNNESAKINIGNKVPILLSSTQFASGTGTQAVSQNVNVTTNIEFKDTGIKLSVDKPNIHLNNDVTVKLSLDITTLGPRVELGENQSQFQFGNRSVETVLNIRDGETVVIGGLIQEDEKKSVNKIPGLGDIPVLGYLFSGLDTEKQNIDLLLTITPHVVRGLETPAEAIQSFWSGTGEAYSTKPLFSDFAPFGGLKESDGLPPLPEIPVESPSPGTGRSPGTPPRGQIPPSIIPPSVPGVPPSSFNAPRNNPRPPVPPSPTGFLPRSKLGPFPGVQSQKETVVMFRPQEGNLTIQQELGMAVMVNQIPSMSEAMLTLSYDPEILHLKSAQEGSFLRQGGVQTSFTTSSNGQGKVKIHLKRLGDTRGISGSGDLIQLTFSGKGVGTSPIFLENPQMLTPAKGYLPIQSMQAQIRVQ